MINPSSLQSNEHSDHCRTSRMPVEISWGQKRVLGPTTPFGPCLFNLYGTRHMSRKHRILHDSATASPNSGGRQVITARRGCGCLMSFNNSIEKARPLCGIVPRKSQGSLVYELVKFNESPAREPSFYILPHAPYTFKKKLFQVPKYSRVRPLNFIRPPPHTA